MSQMDNANPVVLSATDLPTRRGRITAASKSSDSGLIAAIDAFPSYTADPFSLADSSDSEVEEEDSASDPVDAQEIYGRLQSFSLLRFVATSKSLPLCRCLEVHRMFNPSYISFVTEVYFLSSILSQYTWKE